MHTPPMAHERDAIYGSRNGLVTEILLNGYPNDPEKYHWRGHGEKTIERNLYNRGVLSAAGVEVVSQTESQLSAAGHDTLKFVYDADPDLQKMFLSAEAYAAFTTSNLMAQFDYDKATRDSTSRLILPTKPGAACSDWGELGLVFADIDSVADPDMTQMRIDTSRLHGEHTMHKPDPGEIGFKVLSLGVLATILFRNLGSSKVKDIEYFDKKRKQIRENLLIMADDTANEAGQSMKDLIRNRIPKPFLGPVLKLLGIGEIELN